MRPVLELHRQARGPLATLCYVGKAGRAESRAEFTHARVAGDLGRPMGPFAFDPRDLFMACATVRCFDVAGDGQRFYTWQHRRTAPLPPVTHINLILNWFEELKAKVPPTR